MFAKRHLSVFVMFSLSTAALSACDSEKNPTIQGARPLTSQPASEPALVPPAAQPTQDPEPIATDADASDADALVEPATGKMNTPVVLEPVPTHPEVPQVLDPVVFPTPNTGSPRSGPPVATKPPVLPTPRCLGEALTCDRINDFASEWMSNCGHQTGCSINSVCRPVDVLSCASLTDQASCQSQGCEWQVPSPRHAEAPTRRWYDLRRFADVVEQKIVDPAVKMDLHFWNLQSGVTAGEPTVQTDNIVPAICVAPERASVAATCNALTDADACHAHAAICVWENLACAGESQSCDAFAEQGACNTQVGCHWGVD